MGFSGGSTLAYEMPPLPHQADAIDLAPSVRVVPELPEDKMNLARAQRLIKKAGQLVVGKDAERPIIERPESVSYYTTLLDALKSAAIGDKRATKNVWTNVMTDTVERTIKAGHVISVELETNEQGAIKQYGQYMDDVHSNSLRRTDTNTVMWDRCIDRNP